MAYETDHELIDVDAPRVSTQGGGLPASVVMSQRAVAMLRAYLIENNLSHYRVFHGGGHELYDIEKCLHALGESAVWELAEPLMPDGENLTSVTLDDERAYTWESGMLRLAKHDVVLARWYWVDVEDYGGIKVLWLCAARSPADFHRLREEVKRHHRANAASVWQIVRGYSNCDGPRTPRAPAGELIMADALRKRLEADIVRFFSDEVARLYASMNIPFRRGVLLHGPPGNGKTSLIRLIGARLPEVPVLILRPAAAFDSDDMEEVIRRWTAQAPAILVIEDLNWLLEQVNVSTFLNALDGIESGVTGGLLLIATSNDPDKLDPAINNRPGRFDVVIEIASPDKPLRLAFLSRHLPEITPQALEKVAAETDRLSFAHLQEIVRLSGLNTIHAGHAARTDADLIDAAKTVRQAHENAVRGFPIKPEIPFGLLHLREQKS